MGFLVEDSQAVSHTGSELARLSILTLQTSLTGTYCTSATRIRVADVQ